MFDPKQCFEIAGSFKFNFNFKKQILFSFDDFFSEKLRAPEVDLRAGNGIITFECEGLELIGRHPLHLRIAFVPKQYSV